MKQRSVELWGRTRSDQPSWPWAPVLAWAKHAGQVLPPGSACCSPLAWNGTPCAFPLHATSEHTPNRGPLEYPVSLLSSFPGVTDVGHALAPPTCCGDENSFLLPPGLLADPGPSSSDPEQLAYLKPSAAGSLCGVCAPVPTPDSGPPHSCFPGACTTSWGRRTWTQALVFRRT